jgi:hypothetical protein
MFTWSSTNPVGPSTRHSAGMSYFGNAYAPGLGVLFGGTPDGVNALGDTWVYDGTNWVQQFPVTSPPARWGHTMLQRGGFVFLLAGRNGGGLLNTNVWRWDGVTWLNLGATVIPPYEYSGGSFHDFGAAAIWTGTALYALYLFPLFSSPIVGPFPPGPRNATIVHALNVTPLASEQILTGGVTPSEAWTSSFAFLTPLTQVTPATTPISNGTELMGRFVEPIADQLGGFEAWFFGGDGARRWNPVTHDWILDTGAPAGFGYQCGYYDQFAKKVYVCCGVDPVGIFRGDTVYQGIYTPPTPPYTGTDFTGEGGALNATSGTFPQGLFAREISRVSTAGKMLQQFTADFDENDQEFDGDGEAGNNADGGWDIASGGGGPS